MHYTNITFPLNIHEPTSTHAHPLSVSNPNMHIITTSSDTRASS